VLCDLIAHLKDERTLRVLREAIESAARSGSVVVLLDHSPDLPAVLRGYATPFELTLPDDVELEKLIRATVRDLSSRQRLKVELTRRDLETLVRNLHGLSLRQARQIIADVAADGLLNSEDVNAALAQKRRLMENAGALEYVESPVSLESIGGLGNLKRWLSIRQGALTSEASRFGIDPPRGVLMLGVQGAGKSLSAKAVATAWQRPLLRLDAGALYDKFIGESERRLRDALRQAEAMAPVILWIDEIEKAFAATGSSGGGADGGLSKRMFGTLLTWMQEHRAPVFLIATANDISALPPELLRKGRFDEIFFVDLPAEPARRQIFAIHLKKRKRDPGKFDLDQLAAASDGYSGAEIEQAIAAALIEAFSSKTELTTDLLKKKLAESPPLSVTMAERITELRDWSKGRCVSAD
jgi:SpoVK/Ycf46/Vps4 family AAA+-type ATPase